MTVSQFYISDEDTAKAYLVAAFNSVSRYGDPISVEVCDNISGYEAYRAIASFLSVHFEVMRDMSSDLYAMLPNISDDIFQDSARVRENATTVIGNTLRQQRLDEKQVEEACAKLGFRYEPRAAVQ